MKTYVYALIKKGDLFLILKRPSDKNSYPDYWNLPGGKLEENESETDCIKREVMEETSLSFFPFIKIMDMIDFEGKEKKVIVYLGETNNTNLKLNKEHTEYSWVNPKEIKNKKIMPYIIKLFQEVERL
ncbi:MAG: NUDIX domain-containing protein [Nanoarchaeota archaeon]|nr:NUDIX domain-containing protein [Nanoarchaeota archaeon]